MTATRPLAAAVLVALLTAPLAASLCAVGVCDPDAVCELPTGSACAGDELVLRGPDCCLDMPVSATERNAVTGADSHAAVPVPLAVALTTAPPRHPSVALPVTTARSGRATLTLHGALLL